MELLSDLHPVIENAAKVEISQAVQESELRGVKGFNSPDQVFQVVCIVPLLLSLIFWCDKSLCQEVV